MEIMDRLRQERIIAIVRGLKSNLMLDLAQSLCDGGIHLMEVTFNQAAPHSWKDTIKAIAATTREFADAMAIGAGTVMNVEQVQMACEAGARYIVSPIACETVIRETKRLGMSSFPGALTPTEIALAHDAGADAVKIFPAGNLGPGYIKALKAPLEHIDLIAVGGINENNAGSFVHNGAMAVGVGGNLVNRDWIEQGEFAKITRLAKEYAKAVRQSS